MRNRDGFALEATMMVLVLMMVLMLAAYRGAVTTTQSANLDYRAARVGYAAEGGADAILAQLADMLEDGVLEDAEFGAVQPPEVEGFEFSDFRVEKIDSVDVETVTDGPFAGLYSLTQKLEIYSAAVDPFGNTSAIIVSAKAQAFPIFQFGVFYEKDLEVSPGPPMDFRGWVHANGNIYMSSNNAYFWNAVTTPNEVIHNKKSRNQVYNGVKISDASSNLRTLNFDSRTHPNPAAFRTRSNADFDNRLRSNAYDVDSLKLPLPEGVDAYELLRPQDVDDGALERAAKFSWKADMYVTVDLANLSTNSGTCGASLPALPPTTSVGEIGLSYTGLLCPGQIVAFTATHPLLTCAEFDNRALLTIDADLWVTSNGMTGCQFEVTLPNGVARDFKIKIEIKAPDYAQLTIDLLVDAVWAKEDIEAMCGINNGQVQQLLNAVNTAPWPDITVTRTGGLAAPVKEDLCAIFPWQWSAFYDGRERNFQDILNLDIQQLAGWAAGAADKVTYVIYVEFIVPDNLAGYSQAARNALADGTLEPAVRVRNGSQLPNPLTVATYYPLYVQGNYNTGTWQPSSLVGDAISILSNAWDDSRQQQAQVRRYGAATTEINAAILAGHSATPCDWYEPGCPGIYAQRGGQLENFPRFLENWSQRALNFSGSLVSMTVAQYAVGQFVCCSTYYSPPIRNWSFDTRFQDPENLPPGTPVVGNIIHTAFRPVY